MKPVRFGFSVDYAESLEYGTGPLRNMQPTVDGGNYTYDKIWVEINIWAWKKLQMKNRLHRENFVTGVVNRMWEVGMKQHPYWRPAIQWLEDNLQRLFDDGYSLYDIASNARKIAEQCIIAQNLPYSGQLQQSAVLEELDWRELKDGGKEIKDYTDDERNRLFREGGWSAFNSYQQGSKKQNTFNKS